MARSFSAAVFNTQEILALVTRRGYAAAAHAQSSARSGASKAAAGSEESGKAAWAPDPATGYYRPENQAKEIDAAELRRLMVSKTMSPR